MKALAESFFDEITYNELGVSLKGDEILSRLEGCDAYIAGVDYITADVIEKMPQSGIFCSCMRRFPAGNGCVARAWSWTSCCARQM